MERHILERYARADDGSLLIDIDVAKIEDVFSHYDKSAPYLKKDLEWGLVEYIVDSVKETGKEKFTLQFTVHSQLDGESCSRLRASIGTYFLYLKELELRELQDMFRKSLILLLIGIAILTLAVWVSQNTLPKQTVIERVFAEGMTVAAWVSMWESLATILVNWMPHRRNIKMYDRIACAPVMFRSLASQAGISGIASEPAPGI